MSTMQEVGGVSERDVEASFESALEELQGCVSMGVERVSMLSGEITFAVRLGEGGQVLNLWAQQSDLGDRATEVCMTHALEAVSWPPPIGGRTAEAQGSFAFELRPGETPPLVGAANQSERARTHLSKAVRVCSEDVHRESLVVTAYLDESGEALAAGLASRHPVSDQVADCVVEAVLRDGFPALQRRRGPTKFRLRL